LMQALCIEEVDVSYGSMCDPDGDLIWLRLRLFNIFRFKRADILSGC
jgi:hypothetical protein